MKESRNHVCYNPRGLTVLKAALLVRLVHHADCDVVISLSGKSCQARNILSVLSLRIAYGDCVGIVAEGTDAQEVVQTIGGLLSEDSEPGTCLPAYG